MTKHIKPEKYIKDRGQSLVVKVCYLNSNWQEIGKATILIVKHIPKTNYIIGSYQIDLLCLGVKQTAWGYGVTEKKLGEIYTRLSAGKPLAEAPYSLCSQIIREANEFGIKNGLAPHANFETSQYLIEDTSENPIQITFGKDGKPHYKKDEFSNNESIIEQLTASLGADGFTVEEMA